MGKYYVIGGRVPGKEAALIRAAVQRSVEEGKPVAVTSDLTKYRILEEAARRGTQIPEPVVIKPCEKPRRGVTFAGVFIDYQF